jgi:hypothetical protein
MAGSEKLCYFPSLICLSFLLRAVEVNLLPHVLTKEPFKGRRPRGRSRLRILGQNPPNNRIIKKKSFLQGV